jgi:hypothetical protein
LLSTIGSSKPARRSGRIDRLEDVTDVQRAEVLTKTGQH